MSFYRYTYMHQTVEHCLKKPMPGNVDIAHIDRTTTIYTVDLPASVWTAVIVDNDDPMINERHAFTSASLRQEWIDGYIDSLQTGQPLAGAARPGR